MSSEISLATGRETLPTSLWDPHTRVIYRGSPSEMVLEMASGSMTPSVRGSLKSLVKSFQRERGVHIELPWDQDDRVLSTLLIHSLIAIGLLKEGYQA